MAAFLSGGDVICHHEFIKHCTTREVFYRGLRHPEYRVGESSSGLIVTDFQKEFPKSPTVIIERNPEEVHASLEDLGLPAPMHMIDDWQSKLDQLTGMRVPFDHLDDLLPEVCQYLGLRYSKTKHDIFRPLIIETVDFNAQNLSIWR
jgi:hypothetical protein